MYTTQNIGNIHKAMFRLVFLNSFLECYKTLKKIPKSLDDYLNLSNNNFFASTY